MLRKMGIVQNKGNPAVGVSSIEVGTYKFKPFKLTADVHSYRNKVTRGVIYPKPRSGHRIVCDDLNVYSFGGYNPALSSSDEEDLANDFVWSNSKPLFKELWKYNISTGLWSKLEVDKMPDILASNAAQLSGSLLLVYGGTGVPFGANCSKDLYICDLRSSIDKLKFDLICATGNFPQAQYGQAIVIIDHYLYTIGGTTGYEYTCDIHRLNLKDSVWDCVYTCKGTDNEPAGRYRHEVAFDGNKIYVLGGGTAHEAFDFQFIFAFNLNTGMWEKNTARPDDQAVEAYPNPRRCHSCVQYEQYAYIIGGFSGRMILKDIWRLNLITFEWKKFTKFSLDRGVYFHSSCLTSSGKMLTFGGIVQSENSSKRSADVHSAWLCIPKLREICWDAVMFYYPDLNSLSEEDLVLLGLPYDFINRLGITKNSTKSDQVLICTSSI